MDGSQLNQAEREVLNAYDNGRYLDAHHLAEPLGPYTDWTGRDSRILAGRMASRLGSGRLANWMILHAYRSDREHADTRYFWTFQSGYRRVLETAIDMERLPTAFPGVVTLSEWQGLASHYWSLLRDFEKAFALLDAAEKAGGITAHYLSQKSSVLLQADRREDGMSVCEEGLQLFPTYRPLIETKAQILCLLQRRREAIDWLRQHADTTQSSEILTHLATLLFEEEDYTAARDVIDRAESLAVLRDKDWNEWAASRRADIGYLLGDRAAALQHAREAGKVGKGFYEGMAANLEAARPEDKRILLDVEHVAQHHNTCAPATLTMLARYWAIDVDHVNLSDEICYDGTPDHKERHWGEQAGFIVREFTLTVPTAAALIDRGLPFGLATVAPGSAHMQACVGWDAPRGLLLIRDPSYPVLREMLLNKALEQFESVGPRCILLVPPQKQHLLEGIDLPEAALYDATYAMLRALEANDRPAAAAAITSMPPDHRLTWVAHYRLAAYDGDTLTQLRIAEKQHARYPDDANMTMAFYALMRNHRDRDERRAMLFEQGRRKESVPMVWLSYACELAEDARELTAATHEVRRCLRNDPLNARSHATMGNFLFRTHQFDHGLRYHRAASTLERANESLALDYFLACQQRNRADEALAFLRSRVDEFGDKSSDPIVTLYRALNHLDRDDKAFEVLDDGLRRRPEDGELKAYVAMAFGSHGGAERAKALLDEAKPLVRHDVWLRYRADQHRFEAEYAEALACWREIESKSKMDFVAIRNIAQLITALEGEEAARAYLQQQVAAYPHFLELREMAYDWIPAHRLDERLAEVNEAIARNPRNAWAIREKAIILGDMKSFDGPEGAFAILDQAEELQPGVCVVHIVRGRLCEQAKRPDEAREAYARATQLDVDMEYPIRRQLALCKSIDERRAVLETIAQEMSRQVLAGDALFAYRGHAAETYSPGEIADQLREALKARPDLYSAWAALVRQLGDANQLDEAHALAIQTTERFPLLPRAWYDLALICRNRLDDTGERDALDHALRISPGWSMALRTKAEALERSGDFEAARDLALTALRHEPRDSKNHGFLAFYDHKLGKPTEALQSLEKALELDADYEWAWGAYEEWSAEAGQPDKPKEVARRLANERPGEADGWMRLAERLHPLEDAEEVDTALERVLKLQPDSTHALDYKVRVHSFRGEKEEALRLCSAERWPEGVPTTLRERAAIIEHNRGNHAEGLRLAQALVADEPASVSTWCLLCEWHVQSENFEEAMRCADRLLEYEPHSPPTHGYKIHSLIKMGREDDIETDCVRAVRLDPAYLFAGSRLLDLLLRKKRLDEAEQWIVTFRPHWPPDTLIPYDIKLAGARDNAADMEAHIRRLLKTPSEDAHGIQKIQTDYEESDKETSFVILIEEQIDDPDIHPYAASVWARNRIQNGSAKSVIEWLGRQDFPAVAPDKPTARNEVLDAALDEFGRAGERKEFERLLTIYCNVIEADDYLWYQRARAYYNLGEYDTTITAFEGCETRAKLHGVHFLTYINALWNTDRGHQALPVVEYALNLPGNSARQALLVNRSIHCLADELDPNSTLNILGLTFEAGLGEFWSRTRHWLRLLATMTLTDEPKPLQRELKTLLNEKDGLLSSLPEVKRIAYCLDALARNNVHARWCKRWLRKCRRAAKSMQ